MYSVSIYKSYVAIISASELPKISILLSEQFDNLKQVFESLIQKLWLLQSIEIA